MKSKSAHLAQQRIHDQLGEPLPSVHRQALADQPEIALELFGGWIRLGVGKSFAAVA